MNLIFLSHSPTTSTFVVGSHHYLREINKDPQHNALHFASPDYPLSFIKRTRSRVRSYRDFKTYALLPLGRVGLIDRLSNRLIARQVKRILRSEKIETIDCILVDQPAFSKVATILSSLYSAPVIYRPTDIWLATHGSYIRPLEKQIIESAYALMPTSSVVLAALKEEYGSLPHRCAVIENGYDSETFRSMGSQKSIPPKKLVYIGALDARFDFEAIRELSSTGLQIDIYGPITPEALNSGWPANVSLKGVIEYSKVPKKLSEYDAALLPLRDSVANHGRSPMKLYEYLSCRLPIITRRMQGSGPRVLPNIYYYDDQHPISSVIGAIRAFEDMGDILIEQTWAHKSRLLLTYIEQLDSATPNTGD